MDSSQPRKKNWVRKLFRSILKFFVVVLCFTALGAVAGLVLGILAGELLGLLLGGVFVGFVLGLIGGVGGVVYKDVSKAGQIPHSGASNFGGGGDGGAC